VAKVSSTLQQYFGFKVSSSPKSGESPIQPIKKKKDGEGFGKMKFTPELQKFWDWWLNEVHDTRETLKGRVDRYDDLEYMVYNEPIIAMATELYADEATQADTQNQVLHVQAKDAKLEKEILSLFELWDITPRNIREIAYNLALYGDHFNINATKDKEGITDVVQLSPYDVKDRIEFKMSDVISDAEDGRRFHDLSSRDSRIKKLADILENSSNDNLSAMYKSYLFGYQLGDESFLPPWNMSHFRLFTMKSEFYPFGRSMMIFSVSPFRQLKASKNMMALARAAKFPREHFEVEVDENMDETEKWVAVNEARQEYHNLGDRSQEKEQFAIGGELWTPSGLLEYNMIQNNMSLDDIADIELLRDDLIMGTRIPKGYLVVDRSSFGTSGQALLQQFKPFGRAVYYIQSAILHELANMIKIHFIMSGKHQGADTEFELSMNFPVTEESSDRFRMKGDTLRLANDIIGNIQNALGTRDGLPPEVIKSVFGTISFLDPEDVDKWVDQSAESVLQEGTKLVRKDLKEGSIRALQEKVTPSLIREAYFDSLKKNQISEGVHSKRHFVTSYHMDAQQQTIYELLSSSAEGKITG